MTVYRCGHCNQHIEQLLTRFGRRVPFNYQPLPAHQDTNQRGWVPGTWTVRGRELTAMAPVTDYPATRRAALRFVAVPHRCKIHEPRWAALDQLTAGPAHHP